jgi:hypothetical protein
MKLVCFKPMKTEDGKPAICGAVMMTGFDPNKHTVSDRPCRGCGTSSHIDGAGDNWDAMRVNGLPAINSHVKPIREL